MQVDIVRENQEQETTFPQGQCNHSIVFNLNRHHRISEIPEERNISPVLLAMKNLDYLSIKSTHMMQ